MLRAPRLGGVDLQSPHGEAVAVVVDNVEVWRVLQRDAIDGEVVGGVGNDDAGNLLAASCASLFGEIPPCDVFAEEFFAAAAVDHAVAHDA